MNGKKILIIFHFSDIFLRLYYCYDLSRVSACTLPIHSMLHIPVNVSTMGPLWCYWNFPTERFCGTIVRAVSSRKYPYTSMASRLRDVAQLNQIKLVYGLTRELDLSDSHEAETSGRHLADCKLFNIFTVCLAADILRS